RKLYLVLSRFSVDYPTCPIAGKPTGTAAPEQNTSGGDMKTIDRRSAIKTLGLGALGAAGMSAAMPAHAQQAVNWRMQALWDGGTTPQKFEERFVKRVAELTDGKFKIELFSAGQLVPANQ